MVTYQTVMEALSHVIDPEIGLDIVTLGLIYEVEGLETGELKIRMTMTSPGCPMEGIITAGTQDALLRTPGVASVAIKVVWEPAWSPARIDESGRRLLGGQS